MNNDDIAHRVKQSFHQLDKPNLTDQEKNWRLILQWALTGEPVEITTSLLKTELFKSDNENQ